MKMKNKLSKILAVSALSACMLGGVYLVGQNSEVEQTKPTFAYESISNDMPAFFKTENINSTYSFVDTPNDEYASLSFDISSTHDYDNTGSLIGTYFANPKYLAFDITNITTLINGKEINDVDYSSMIAEYYDLTGAPGDPDAERTYLYGLNFFPKNIDMQLGVDLSKDKAEVDGNTLILNEQGLVSITISYTQYELNATKSESGVVTLDAENVYSNQKLTFNFFLLDKNEYLEIGTTDSPAVEYAQDIVNRTNSGTITYKYNYFYNYATSEVPFITYNLKNYEVKIIKIGTNNQTNTNHIKYDATLDEFKVFDKDGIEVANTDTSLVKNGDNLSIYFNNTGEYILQYEPICISQGRYYTIDHKIESQRFYVFGYQGFYTIKSATYAELKQFSNGGATYDKPADITYEFKKTDDPLNLDEASTLTISTDPIVNPIAIDELNEIAQNYCYASTDQTPIKFSTIEGVSPNAKSVVYYLDENGTWTKSAFSIIDTFSLPGKYIVQLGYNFSAYTNKSGTPNNTAEFDQFFAFEISKASPSVDVFTGTPLPDGTYENKSEIQDVEFTNELVYIHYDQFENKYNKPVDFEIIRYDYYEKTTTAEYIDWYADSSLYSLKENGTIVVSADGNYTINIFLADAENPIKRSFTIDTNKNFNLKSYSVEKSSATQNNYATTEVETITNQSILFSWDNVKPSGARTSAYYKYYPISATNLFTEDFINNDLYLFVNKNVSPVEYQLNLSASANWLKYENFNYEENSNKIVSSMYTKSNAGLYVIQAMDVAGNTQTRIYIIDNSTPPFIMYNPETSMYELLSKNNTITEDATIIWGKHKVIKINKNASGNFDIENPDSTLFKNRNGEYDPSIYEQFNSLICDRDLANAKENANISYLSLPYQSSPHSSYYLCVDINDDIYFKNYCVGDDGYVFISGEELGYEYEIVSSYKIYLFNNTNKLYRSTTVDNYYQSIETSGSLPVYNSDTSSMTEVEIYLYNGTNYLIKYSSGGFTFQRLFDKVNNLVKESVSVSKQEDDLYYNGFKLTKVEFVDKEGQYVFLLRDGSNTKGANVSPKNQYLSYPSTYQYITVSADQSQLRTFFVDANGDEISLADSSYFVPSSEILNEGTEDEIIIMKKSSFFSPTNEDVIYISFIPTIYSGETQIQVKEVSIKYYEFDTQIYNHISGDPYSNYTVYNYYKTLKEVWSEPVIIYSFVDDGEIDSEFRYELNISEQKTKAGFYEITRTYMTNENKAPTDTNDYLVTTYDYHERKQNAYIDRYDVITESETISPEVGKGEVVAKQNLPAGADQEISDLTLTYYFLDERYLYMPIKEEGTSKKLIATNANGDYTDLSTEISLTLEDSSGATNSIKWSNSFQNNTTGNKFFTDTSGQRYLLLDFEKGVTYGGRTYIRFVGLSATTNPALSIYNTNDILYDALITPDFMLETNIGSYTGTSTQSLVGGSMLVTMYSTFDNTASVVSISHPSQTTDKTMLFNSGDSFYTREDTTNYTDLTTLFNTNKLPVSISIPKYKYATYFVQTTENSNVATGKNVICNYVYETEALSYYTSGNKESSISSYELEVEVDYYENEILDNIAPTKVYKSNGDILQNVYSYGGNTQVDNSGYLALYEYNTQTGVFSALKKEFTEAGYYVVRVTQAPYEVEASSYNFKSTYSFCFYIEKNKPQYDIYAGTLLKSIEDTSFYADSSNLGSEDNTIYYTNKDEISVVWSDTSSVYKANIDKTEIKISFAGGTGSYNGTYKLILTEPTEGNTRGNVEVKKWNNYSWIATDALTASQFTYNYAVTTLTNTLIFDLSSLRMNTNNSQTMIEMQLVGHNEEYYDTTVKTVIYDQTASSNTISSLHAYLNNEFYGLKPEDVREYYLADGVTLTDVSKASFNQTISSGVYAQYSYVVSMDFFEGLQANIKNNIDTGIHSSTTSAYYKKVKDDYIPTSNTYDFVEAEFTQITALSTFDDILDELETSKQYEIVEKDLAGNITVYIVYINDKDGFYDNDAYGDELQNGITYTPDGEVANYTALKDSDIMTNKYEVSAGSKLDVVKVNLYGDEWTYFYTSIYNTTLGTYLNSYYLATPELDEGYVYKVTGVANKVYTRYALADIFKDANSLYKNSIYILDKLSGNYNVVDFALSDSASLSIVTGESGTTQSKVAFLSIAMPSSTLYNDSITKAYPVEIVITDTSDDADQTIFRETNNPNDYIHNVEYSYLEKWLSLSNNFVSVSYANEYLTFTIKNVISDTKLSFEVLDNFGNRFKEIYLVGETKVQEITSNGNYYNYYANVDSNVNYAYISTTDFNVNYNKEKYIVKTVLLSAESTGIGLETVPTGTFLNLANLTQEKNTPFYASTTTQNSINTITFASKQHQYDIWLKVMFYDKDDETNLMKTYYLRLYNVLPNRADDMGSTFDHYFTFTNSNGGDDTNDLLQKKGANEEPEFLMIGDVTYVVYSSHQTFSDELKVAYSSSENLDFPYEVLYLYESENWENGEDFVPLSSGTTLDQNGIFYILVRYTSTEVLTKEYYLFKIEILGSGGGFYYIEANGVRKEKAEVYYTTPDNKQYSDYYIVNINYQDRALEEKFKIITNDYQNVKYFEMPSPYFEGTGIYTYRYIVTNYLYNNKVPTTATEAELAGQAPTEIGISPYKQTIFVTFLNPSDDILSITNGTTSNLYYKTNDTADLYITNTTSQVNMIIYDETADTNTMTISWFKYYGIEANLIKAYITKDGRDIKFTTHESGNYYYINLTRSGSYIFKFEDTAGNVQTFYSGQKNLPVIFIKDVHFTIEYTNPLTTEKEETEMINKSVYNGDVKLKLNTLLIPYYQDSGFGSGNIITAYKNGVEYKDFVFSTEDYSFTFKETGYYTVSMSAKSKSTGGQIRNEVYSFSIINPKESRYAYEFSGYQNYYIERVIKDGIDITSALFEVLKTDTNVMTVGKTKYLKNLLISYFDEKTGTGRYEITINSNDELYLSGNGKTSSFTFEFFINSNVVPISVSINEGGATEGNVTVTFNAKNVYEAVGECYVVVGKDTYYVNELTTETINLILGDNESHGTHYIQVFSMSGNLLFSHKVSLNEPMNAWTVIAIIAGVIAVVLIVFIIVKLRKRMGVK